MSKPEGDPMERLQQEVALRLMMCRLVQKNVNLGGDPHEISDCVANSKKAVLTLYDAAAKKTKKTAAREALKGYVAAATSAIAGTARGDGEAQLIYSARQTTNNQKLSELWSRVQLESR